MLSLRCALPYLIVSHSQHRWIAGIIIPVWQMRKLSLRKISNLVNRGIGIWTQLLIWLQAWAFLAMLPLLWITEIMSLFLLKIDKERVCSSHVLSLLLSLSLSLSVFLSLYVNINIATENKHINSWRSKRWKIILHLKKKINLEFHKSF